MATPETIDILVNGRAERVRAGLALTDLIADKRLDRRYLVVEYNGEPLDAQRVLTVTLNAGDRLELVRPVAGG